MRKNLAYIFAFISWSAVTMQYWIMLEASPLSWGAATIRFFSFFTILTNTLLALYFSSQIHGDLHNRGKIWKKSGTLTAITVYILVVGLVYQVVLRSIWDPQGMARVTDELLHTLNPLLALIFWWLFEDKKAVEWKQVPYWLIYPLGYFVYTVIHGQISGFYPYPFVDLNTISVGQLGINFLVLAVVFMAISGLLVWVGKKSSMRQT
ncbi:Pr6Pr family membrane protein [Mongoliitalea daihaiensis]|uniref:Pr6Pr family membrane protein n=1 Tax=Mongoliitalea daihaiensis TaxID=2782006 RepID=UPI001F2EE1EF|nr:Pr6Pr family membrane protein [Mongoliitalea daihaiensis]UJP65358.1 Pr6Pr family membrane protein [Mongoliitalea daihaiensis]